MIDKQSTKNKKHQGKIKLLILLCSLLLIEGSVRLMMGTGMLRYRHYNTYISDVRFAGDINKHFGVWHYPNVKLGETLVYQSNAQGMRDRQRSLKSDAPRRIVVLGDSFVEGAGVNVEERMTDILEGKRDIEHLNFGTSGHFGPIQQWLCYEHLASTFDHSEVYLFCLPDNDFKDNEPTEHKPNRYRPYLKGDQTSNFELYYPVEFEKRSGQKPRQYSFGKRVKRHIYNSVYTVNALRQLTGIKFAQSFAGSTVSPYDDFVDLDAQRMVYSYQQIVKLAGDKPFHIFIIPRHKDFAAYNHKQLQNRVTPMLEAFASEYQNVKVHDLLPYMLKYIQNNNLTYHALFLPSDGHWNDLGNQVAAKAVMALAGEDKE